MPPQAKDSSLLDQVLSRPVTQVDSIDACSAVAGLGPAAPFPLSSTPDYDPAALSISQWEARREAPKSSWGARVNQTLCRSLAEVCLCALGAHVIRSPRLHLCWGSQGVFQTELSDPGGGEDKVSMNS